MSSDILLKLDEEREALDSLARKIVRHERWQWLSGMALWVASPRSPTEPFVASQLLRIPEWGYPRAFLDDLVRAGRLGPITDVPSGHHRAVQLAVIRDADLAEARSRIIPCFRDEATLCLAVSLLGDGAYIEVRGGEPDDDEGVCWRTQAKLPRGAIGPVFTGPTSKVARARALVDAFERLSAVSP